jgi:hypothetical protein
MALGTNPDWNFPRRRCDDCNKSYKPTRPNSRYCSTVCRDAHNRHGGAYRKLKVEMQKMVRQMEVRLEAKLDEYVQLAVRDALGHVDLLEVYLAGELHTHVITYRGSAL